MGASVGAPCSSAGARGSAGASVAAAVVAGVASSADASLVEASSGVGYVVKMGGDRRHVRLRGDIRLCLAQFAGSGLGHR